VIEAKDTEIAALQVSHQAQLDARRSNSWQARAFS
jgi:hypothetical protein